MKITFNLQGVGLADNGGSATIVNSANALSSLGHAVVLVSEKKNELTWCKLDGPQYIQTDGITHNYPPAWAVIATGAHSVQHVLNGPAELGRKFWWVRAHETWAMDEKMLFDYYENPHISILANSIGLHKFITGRVETRVQTIRPGLDFENFYETKERVWEGKEKFVIGGLYCDKPRKRFQWTVEIYEACKAHGIPAELHLYGTYKEPEGTGCSKYLYKPSVAQLREFYNEVDIWIAPTKSEGLHMPPQEAMLCGCVVIGATEPLSGMQDYLIQKAESEKATGFTMGHWNDAVEVIDALCQDSSALPIISVNGRKKILELGDRQANMAELVNILKKGEKPSIIAHRELELTRRGNRARRRRWDG